MTTSGIVGSEGAEDADRPGRGARGRGHGGDHRRSPGQRRDPGPAPRRGPQGRRGSQPDRLGGPGRAGEAEAGPGLPAVRPGAHRGGQPGGRPPSAGGMRLGGGGGRREHGGEEAAARGAGGAAPAGRRRPLEQHERAVGERDRRGPSRDAAPALPRHPLLQPAALHAPRRGGSQPLHRPGPHRRDVRLHLAAARQGRGAGQGHPQLRGQPDRRLRHVQRHPPHGGPGPDGGGGGRRGRPGDGASSQRLLPHRRPGGDRHARARGAELLGRAAGRREAGHLPDARVRLADGREGAARQQVEAGLLQEDQGGEGRDLLLQSGLGRVPPEPAAEVRLRGGGQGDRRSGQAPPHDARRERQGRRDGVAEPAGHAHLRLQPRPRRERRLRRRRRRHALGIQLGARAVRDARRHRGGRVREAGRGRGRGGPAAAPARRPLLHGGGSPPEGTRSGHPGLAGRASPGRHRRSPAAQEGGRRGRSERRRLGRRPGRRGLLPRVPHQDERHRRRRAGHGPPGREARRDRRRGARGGEPGDQLLRGRQPGDADPGHRRGSPRRGEPVGLRLPAGHHGPQVRPRAGGGRAARHGARWRLRGLPARRRRQRAGRDVHGARGDRRGAPARRRGHEGAGPARGPRGRGGRGRPVSLRVQGVLHHRHGQGVGVGRRGRDSSASSARAIRSPWPPTGSFTTPSRRSSRSP